MLRGLFDEIGLLFVLLFQKAELFFDGLQAGAEFFQGLDALLFLVQNPLLILVPGFLELAVDLVESFLLLLDLKGLIRGLFLKVGDLDVEGVHELLSANLLGGLAGEQSPEDGEGE